MPITQQLRTCPEYVRFWIPSTIEETVREREREGEGKEKDKQRHRHRGHRDTDTETSERGRETERKSFLKTDCFVWPSSAGLSWMNVILKTEKGVWNVSAFFGHE